MKKTVDHCIIKMKDGSVYDESNIYWVKAINMRIKERGEGWTKDFALEVDKHWKQKTIPTKFDWDDPWKKKYKNHADLAQEVMYPYIRVIIMGLAFEELSPKKKKAKVLALNNDGSVTEYPSGKKHKNIDEAIKTKKKKVRR
jgi:hypothetical protein